MYKNKKYLQDTEIADLLPKLNSIGGETLQIQQRNDGKHRKTILPIEKTQERAKLGDEEKAFISHINNPQIGVNGPYADFKLQFFLVKEGKRIPVEIIFQNKGNGEVGMAQHWVLNAEKIFNIETVSKKRLSLFDLQNLLDYAITTQSTELQEKLKKIHLGEEAFFKLSADDVLAMQHIGKEGNEANRKKLIQHILTNFMESQKILLYTTPRIMELQEKEV